MAEAAKPVERNKRTIGEIRDSKKTGEKFVYTSVLDYTSAKWAQTAEVRAGRFPDDDHSYGVDDKEYKKFLGLVEKRRHV